MHLTYRNVNDAFQGLVRLFHLGHDTVVRTQSRNGPVMMINEPTLITYQKPQERVLFNAARDINPFMHVYEALWMLAGRNDVAPLAWYTKQFAEYSDDGNTINDAYGYRWRRMFDLSLNGPGDRVDQLDILVNHLRQNPDSRRAVLTMWNVEDDLLKVDTSKAVCCNLNVMFALRERRGPSQIGLLTPALDITVTNRSNDLIWGTLGTNFTTFSFLQEYIAARLGVEVGVYHQFTNNLHVYGSNWKPKEWLECEQGEAKHQYHANVTKIPLVQDPVAFDREVRLFAEYAWGPADRMENAAVAESLTEPFLAEVALPLYLAYAAHKVKDDAAALLHLGNCAADDWRMTAQNWIKRRMERKTYVSE